MTFSRPALRRAVPFILSVLVALTAVVNADLAAAGAEAAPAQQRRR